MLGVFRLCFLAQTFAPILFTWYTRTDCLLLLYLNMSTYDFTGDAGAAVPNRVPLLGSRELRRQSLTLLLLN